MIKQADQVSLSQESPSHVTDTPSCVRAKVWLFVDKETEKLFQPWSSQKLKIELKLGKKHQSQTHMHLHPPVYLHIINIYKLGVKLRSAFMAQKYVT